MLKYQVKNDRTFGGFMHVLIYTRYGNDHRIVGPAVVIENSAKYWCQYGRPVEKILYAKI